MNRTSFKNIENGHFEPIFVQNRDFSKSQNQRFFTCRKLYRHILLTKGTLITECGSMLQKGGYNIKTLNTIDFSRSMHYNPFAYIHSEKDILKLVNVLIANTKGEGDKSGEDFWVKAERLLFYALFGFLYYEAPPKEQNFSMLLDLINAFEVHEEDEQFMNAIDMLFDDLKKKNPDHFAVRQYAKFKLAAGVLI